MVLVVVLVEDEVFEKIDQKSPDFDVKGWIFLLAAFARKKFDFVRKLIDDTMPDI